MPKMLLLTEVAPMLPRDRIIKTAKEGKNWEKQRKYNETEFALYHYGCANLTGLSDRICTQQTTLVCKIKRKRPCAEFIRCGSSLTGQMTNWKL
jgi:hypothetical protein